MKHIKHLEHDLREVMELLKDTYRWGSLEREQENVLDHSFKMAFIVQLMLSMEHKGGNPHDLDFFRLLQCAINHDFGEAFCGDTPLPFRTDKKEKEEEAAYEKLMQRFVPKMFRSFFPQPIDRDDSQSQDMVDFWMCAESIGYALYAIEQSKTAVDNRFQKVVWRALGVIRHHRRFASVRIFYNILCFDGL